MIIDIHESLDVYFEHFSDFSSMIEHIFHKMYAVMFLLEYLMFCTDKQYPQ